MSPITLVTKMTLISAENQQDLSVTTRALGNLDRCVRGYSSKNDFLGSLGDVIYRLWNAVKAIFGKSDWQKGRAALKILSNITLLPLATNYDATMNRHEADTLLKKYIVINENETLVAQCADPNICNLEQASIIYKMLYKEVGNFMDSSKTTKELKSHMENDDFMTTPLETNPKQDDQEGEANTWYAKKYFEQSPYSNNWMEQSWYPK